MVTKHVSVCLSRVRERYEIVRYTVRAWPGLAWLLSRNVKLRITRAITPLGIESLTRCIIFQLPSESRLMLPRTQFSHNFAGKRGSLTIERSIDTRRKKNAFESSLRSSRGAAFTERGFLGTRSSNKQRSIKLDSTFARGQECFIPIVGNLARNGAPTHAVLDRSIDNKSRFWILQSVGIFFFSSLAIDPSSSSFLFSFSFFFYVTSRYNGCKECKNVTNI